jgi:hypothetical protein
MAAKVKKVPKLVSIKLLPMEVAMSQLFIDSNIVYNKNLDDESGDYCPSSNTECFISDTIELLQKKQISVKKNNIVVNYEEDIVEIDGTCYPSAIFANLNEIAAETGAKTSLFSKRRYINDDYDMRILSDGTIRCGCQEIDVKQSKEIYFILDKVFGQATKKN